VLDPFVVEPKDRALELLHHFVHYAELMIVKVVWRPSSVVFGSYVHPGASHCSLSFFHGVEFPADTVTSFSNRPYIREEDTSYVSR
jgi:hypothetical protein